MVELQRLTGGVTELQVRAEARSHGYSSRVPKGNGERRMGHSTSVSTLGPLALASPREPADRGLASERASDGGQLRCEAVDVRDLRSVERDGAQHLGEEGRGHVGSPSAWDLTTLDARRICVGIAQALDKRAQRTPPRAALPSLVTGAEGAQTPNDPLEFHLERVVHSLGVSHADAPGGAASRCRARRH